MVTLRLGNESGIISLKLRRNQPIHIVPHGVYSNPRDQHVTGGVDSSSAVHRSQEQPHRRHEDNVSWSIYITKNKGDKRLVQNNCVLMRNKQRQAKGLIMRTWDYLGRSV